MLRSNRKDEKGMKSHAPRVYKSNGSRNREEERTRESDNDRRVNGHRSENERLRMDNDLYERQSI